MTSFPSPLSHPVPHLVLKTEDGETASQVKDEWSEARLESRSTVKIEVVCTDDGESSTHSAGEWRKDEAFHPGTVASSVMTRGRVEVEVKGIVRIGDRRKLLRLQFLAQFQESQSNGIYLSLSKNVCEVARLINSL